MIHTEMDDEQLKHICVRSEYVEQELLFNKTNTGLVTSFLMLIGRFLTICGVSIGVSDKKHAEQTYILLTFSITIVLPGKKIVLITI